MTPNFQERNELKVDGGFSETQDLKSAGGGESNLDSRTNSDPSETNPESPENIGIDSANRERRKDSTIVRWDDSASWRVVEKGEIPRLPRLPRLPREISPYFTGVDSLSNQPGLLYSPVGQSVLALTPYSCSLPECIPKPRDTGGPLAAIPHRNKTNKRQFQSRRPIIA